MKKGVAIALAILALLIVASYVFFSSSGSEPKNLVSDDATITGKVILTERPLTLSELASGVSLDLYSNQIIWSDEISENLSIQDAFGSIIDNILFVYDYNFGTYWFNPDGAYAIYNNHSYYSQRLYDTIVPGHQYFIYLSQADVLKYQVIKNCNEAVCEYPDGVRVFNDYLGERFDVTVTRIDDTYITLVVDGQFSPKLEQDDLFVTSSGIKVTVVDNSNYGTYGLRGAILRIEKDSGSSSGDVTYEGVLKMLNQGCTIYSVAAPSSARLVSGDTICQERNAGTCIFTVNTLNQKTAIERCGNQWPSDEHVAYCCSAPVSSGDTCTDSDGGVNYYEAGTATNGREEWNSTRRDFCGFQGLNEAYCNDEGYPEWKLYDCEYGCAGAKCYATNFSYEDLTIGFAQVDLYNSSNTGIPNENQWVIKLKGDNIDSLEIGSERSDEIYIWYANNYSVTEVPDDASNYGGSYYNTYYGVIEVFYRDYSSDNFPGNKARFEEGFPLTSTGTLKKTQVASVYVRDTFLYVYLSIDSGVPTLYLRNPQGSEATFTIGGVPISDSGLYTQVGEMRYFGLTESDADTGDILIDSIDQSFYNAPFVTSYGLIYSNHDSVFKQISNDQMVVTIPSSRV